MDLEYTTMYNSEVSMDYQKNARKDVLVIVDNSGIRELDLSNYADATYTFGRANDNSIVINSDIVSAHHGEIVISRGIFYLKDNGSSNGTYIAYGQQFSKIMPNEFYGGDNHDMIIRLGTTQSMNGQDAVLMLYDNNAASGSWKTYALHDGDNSVGRADNCDIRIKNVAVSRYHAGIRCVNGQMYLFDNKSTNGVFLNGIKIGEPKLLSDKDIFTIMNATFIVNGNQIFYKFATEGIALELRNLNKDVPSSNGKKTILDKVSLSIGANEFVAIIGGSGAGKTTLMTAMSGFDTDITGDVFCNGISLRDNFQTLKNIIGFVPQQDIIYENITLKKMLYFTAKLKMPEDTSNDEIEARIRDVLDMVELTSHQDTYIRRLSGGQKKRASIAVELLANPGLFFLDEPTSGLDPGTEQHLMHTLSKLSKEQEKTIIMVTHTTNNLHLCDKVIIMGYGGRLCYCGSPDGIKDFFNTDEIVKVYDMITSDTKGWENRFKTSGINKLSSCVGASAGKEIKPKKASNLNQLSVLVRRYVTLIKNDMERLVMIFIQPILIGFLMALVAEKGIYEKMFETRSILFALMSAGIWMGLFNTIQEVYKERVILKREYMANLKLPLYMLSKYIVQALIAVIQSVILVAVFVAVKGSPECDGVIFGNAVLEMAVTIFVTIYASAGFGLLISSASKNGDRAMSLAPFVLIFQLLFSGILFSLNGVTEKVSYLTFSRWSMEALGSTNDLNELTPVGAEDMEEIEKQVDDMKEQMEDMKEKMEDMKQTIYDLSYGTITFDEEASDVEDEKEDKEEEIDKMFKRSSGHTMMCWGLLFVSTFAFAGASIMVLTKLKDEQR